MTDVANAPLGRPPNQLVFLVGEVSGKLDTLMGQLPNLSSRIDGLDVRVVSLEVSNGRIVGGLAVITFLIGAWEIVRYFVFRN